MQTSNGMGNNQTKDIPVRDSFPTTQIPIEFARFNQHSIQLPVSGHPYHQPPLPFPCMPLLHNHPTVEHKRTMPSEQYRQWKSNTYRKIKPIPGSIQLGLYTDKNQPVFFVPSNLPTFHEHPGQPRALPPTKSSGVGLPIMITNPVDISEATHVRADDGPSSNSSVYHMPKTETINKVDTIPVQRVLAVDDRVTHERTIGHDDLHINWPCLQPAIQAPSSQNALNRKVNQSRSTCRKSLSSVQNDMVFYSNFSPQKIARDGCRIKTTKAFGVLHQVDKQKTDNVNATSPTKLLRSPYHRQGDSDEYNEEYYLSSPESIPPDILEDWSTLDIMRENSKNLQILQNQRSSEIVSPVASLKRNDRDSVSDKSTVLDDQSPPKNSSSKEGTPVQYREPQSQINSLDYHEENSIHPHENLERKSKQRKRKRSTHSADTSFPQSESSDVQQINAYSNVPTHSSVPDQEKDLQSVDNAYVTDSKYVESDGNFILSVGNQDDDNQPENLCLRDLREKSPPNIVYDKIDLQTKINLSMKETKDQIKLATSQVEILLNLLTQRSDSKTADEFVCGLLTVLQAGCRLNSNLINSLELYQSRQELQNHNSLVSENKSCSSETYIPCLVQECPLDLRIHHGNLRMTQGDLRMTHDNLRTTPDDYRNNKAEKHVTRLASSVDLKKQCFIDENSITPQQSLEAGHLKHAPISLNCERQQYTDARRPTEVSLHVTSAQSSPDRLIICDAPYISDTISCLDTHFEPGANSSIQPLNDNIPSNLVTIKDAITVVSKKQPQDITDNPTKQALPLIAEKTLKMTSDLEKCSLTSDMNMKPANGGAKGISSDHGINIGNLDISSEDIKKQTECVTPADNEKEPQCQQEYQTETKQTESNGQVGISDHSLVNAVLPNKVTKRPMTPKDSNSIVSKQLAFDLDANSEHINEDPDCSKVWEVRLSRCTSSNSSTNSSVCQMKAKLHQSKAKKVEDTSDLDSKHPNGRGHDTINPILCNPDTLVPTADRDNIYGLMYSELSPDESSDNDSTPGSPEQKTISTATVSDIAGRLDQSATYSCERHTNKVELGKELTTKPPGDGPNPWRNQQRHKIEKSTEETLSNKSKTTREKLTGSDISNKKNDSTPRTKHKSTRTDKSKESSQSTPKKDSVSKDKAEGCSSEESGDVAPSTPSKRKRKAMSSKKPTAVTKTCESISDEIIRPTKVRGLKDQYRQACFKVFDRVYNFSWSEPFRDEIKRKQVPDYFKIIKRPMHLQLIACKLRQGLYRSIEEFVGDMRLIFSNCRLYHKPHPLQISPELLIAANNVEEFLDHQLRKIFPDLRAMTTS